MKLRIFVLFLVFNAALCDKKPNKSKKLIVPQLSSECNNIKSSAAEEPACLKLKHKHHKNSTMYIIMINKCEMQYMKCHQGFEATIVPMKHCRHNSATVIKNNSNTTTNKNDHMRRKRHVRVRVRARRKDDISSKVATPTEVNERETIVDVNHDGLQEYLFYPLSKARTDAYSVKFKVKTDNSAHFALTTEPFDANPIVEVIIGSWRNKLSLIKRDNIMPGYSRIERKGLLDPDDFRHFWISWKDGNIKVGSEGETDPFMSWTDPEPFPIRYVGVRTWETTSSWIIEGIKLDETAVEEPVVSDDFPPNEDDVAVGVTEEIVKIKPMDSIEPTGSTEIPGDMVSDEEYEALCPRVCPSRDVMVCAKYQTTGIYQTFMSVCHMRMYTCKHPDEKLRLASRQPCVQSAPYMSQEGMRPRKRVSHPDDEDEVLRFIMCRDKGMLGIVPQNQKDNKAAMVDTRCRFILQKEEFVPTFVEQEDEHEILAY